MIEQKERAAKLSSADGVRKPFLSQAITVAASDQSAVAIKPALHAN